MRLLVRPPFTTSIGLASWNSVAVSIQLVSLAAALFLLSPRSTFAHGTFHEMMDELQVELTARPNDHALIVRRAFLELEHEDWQAALVDLEKAARLGADEGDLVYLRGRALKAGKQWAAAKVALDEFFATHPANAAAHAERARVLWQLDHKSAALDDFRAAMNLSPRPEPELVNEVAEALDAQALPEESLKVLDDGIQVLGNVPQLVLKAMEYEIAAKRFDAALARVDAMQKMMPRPEPWMARRASVLAQAGRYEDSRAAWKALREHLMALPNLERGSHAMTTLLTQCDDAINALAQVSSQDSTPPSAKP